MRLPKIARNIVRAKLSQSGERKGLAPTAWGKAAKVSAIVNAQVLQWLRRRAAC